MIDYYRWEMTEKKRVEERREGEREREGRRIVRGSKVKYFFLTENLFFSKLKPSGAPRDLGGC